MLIYRKESKPAKNNNTAPKRNMDFSARASVPRPHAHDAGAGGPCAAVLQQPPQTHQQIVPIPAPLPKEQIEGYNALLAGPNWKVALDTLKTLQAQKAGGGEPNLVSPKTPASGGTTVGYKTEDDMRADMRNPLYFQQTPDGERFRAQVAEKVRLAAYRRQER